MVIFGLFFNAAIVLTLFFYVTAYMVGATINYSLLIWGLLFRGNRKIHVPCMNTAIFLDVTIVLALELSRDAVATAASFSLSFWQQFHIAASLIAVLLYLPTVVLGWKRFYQKSPRGKIFYWHRGLGITAFFFRTLGFLSMFSMIEHVIS